MPGRFDLFDFFRFMLALVVSIYCLIRFIMWATLALRAVAGTDRTTGLLRNYLAVQLLRIRIRRFFLDLTQIAALSVLLLLLIRRHWG